MAILKVLAAWFCLQNSSIARCFCLDFCRVWLTCSYLLKLWNKIKITMSSSENESSVDEQSEIEEDPSDLGEEQEQSNDESGQEASSDENADSDEETGDESKVRSLFSHNLRMY